MIPAFCKCRLVIHIRLLRHYQEVHTAVRDQTVTPGHFRRKLRIGGCVRHALPLVRKYFAENCVPRGDKPDNASAMRTRISCMVSIRCSFLRRRRYNRAYDGPSESNTASAFALGCRSTFLIRASSSDVTRPAR